MGRIQSMPPVRPVAGLLGSTEDLMQKAKEALVSFFGSLRNASDIIPFTHTDYYATEMGTGLLRQFLVFETLRAAEELAEWKIAGNRMEAELGVNEKGGRQVNIDPGYLAPGKLVLASTKDHEHRVYLQKGVYAEVTLRVRNKRFCTWEWTYPDYAEATGFFERAYKDYIKIVVTATNRDISLT